MTRHRNSKRDVRREAAATGLRYTTALVNRRVRTDYSRLAERYDEDRARFAIPPDDVIAELIRTRPGIRVLDVGCGTGTWLAAQRAAFGDAIDALLGIDPFVSMLLRAQDKGVSTITCTRAEHLPFSSASLDYVVSSFNFHHFANKDRALDEVSRVLDFESGVFRMNNIDPESSTDWWVYEFFPDTIAVDEARFWSSAHIATALDERGFAVDLDLVPGVTHVPAREALADAERRVISQLAVLDDDAYARGVKQLRVAATRPGATVTMAATLQATARRQP